MKTSYKNRWPALFSSTGFGVGSEVVASGARSTTGPRNGRFGEASPVLGSWGRVGEDKATGGFVLGRSAGA